MSAVDLLDSVTNDTFTNLTAKSFDELAKGEYRIVQFKLNNTRFGLRLTVHFEDFFVWLPSRFSDKISSQDQVNELNQKAASGNYFMRYDGKDKDRKGFLLIKFIDQQHQ